MKRITAVLAGAVLAILPTVASAQAVGGSVTSFGPADWLALVLRLGLVIGVIWAAVYAMRWYTQRAGGERAGTLRALDIVETRSLGPNRALHVVRVGDRAVVIGVTPERISTLMQIDEPEVLDRLELTAGGSARPAASFGALLAGLGAGPKSARASVEDEAARAEFRGAGAVPTAGLGLTADESVRLAVSEPAWSRGGSSSGARGHSREEVRGASATQDPVPSGHHLRNMTERLLGVLGFTPVESAPDLIARLRAQRIAAQAAMPVAMPTSVAIQEASARSLVRPAGVPAAPVLDAVRGATPSLFDRLKAESDDLGKIAAVVAPAATQTLRALSGYAAAQRSANAGLADSMAEMEAMDRDERIAEAQRAISAARMAG